jgi:hypothetical protein
MSFCHVVRCVHCGFESCGECKEAAHAPATCAEKQKWEMLTGDELMTRRLLGDNFKTCPKCKTQIEKNGGCFMMTCTQCRLQFCWACQRAWSNHTQDHFTCPYYKAEDDPFKKQVDDVDPRFVGQYMTPFLKKKVFAAAIRERMTASIQEITRRVQADEVTPDDIAGAIRNLLEQMSWAAENVRWAQVHLFCERYEQVKALVGDAQLNPKVPPTTPHQNMFEAAVKQLDECITEVDRRIKTLQTPSSPRLTLRELSIRAKQLTVYRDMMLKHCDSHYRDSREWAVRPG